MRLHTLFTQTENVQFVLVFSIFADLGLSALGGHTVLIPTTVCCWQVLGVLDQAMQCAAGGDSSVQISDSQLVGLQQALCSHFRQVPAPTNTLLQMLAHIPPSLCLLVDLDTAMHNYATEILLHRAP